MADSIWFEVTGGTWATRIYARIVSSETAAFVFHPNGRKSAKKSLASTFCKTFEDAKQEALTWLSVEIEKSEEKINRLRVTQEKILNLKREDIIHE